MKRSRGRPPKQNDADFVHTWDDLAHRLGVSRRGLQKIRERFKDDPELPRARGDRHHIPSWLAFFAKRELGKQPESSAGDENTKAYWDRRRGQLAFERETYAFELDKQKHLPIAETTAAVGQMLAGFRTALNTMPSSAARWLIGQRDFVTIKNKLQEEVDAVLQALGRCDYLENLTPVTVGRLFGGRDEAFRSDLSHCVESVFQELGRLSLANLFQRTLPSDQEPPKAIDQTLAAKDAPRVPPPKPKLDSPQRKHRVRK